MEGQNSAAPEDTISDDGDEDLLDESSDHDVAQTSEEETETRQQCVCCMEEYSPSDIIQTECAHTYCYECIARLFENALSDEAMFPPRCCCLPIHVSTAVEDMIGTEMIKRYEERKIETSDFERTYCAIPTCSHYIPPQNIRRGVGICGLCQARTCTDCKAQGHRGDCDYKNANHYSSASCDKKAKAKKKAMEKRRAKAKKKAEAKKKATTKKKATAKKKTMDKKKALAKEMARAKEKARMRKKVNDKNYGLLEKLAKKKKWQRCFRCSRIIERVSVEMTYVTTVGQGEGPADVILALHQDFAQKVDESVNAMPRGRETEI
ncbi:Zinc finger, C6HC-type [Penicillium italicum]|uniref:Zinc finger, C6HC-type n=1 Tax=Penicillium italicum TaxID=40296 RepID=A0A0A2L6I1_PENIT|nr:Zinc finger, C6HC-type [Penicillium italicum]